MLACASIFGCFLRQSALKRVYEKITQKAQMMQKAQAYVNISCVKARQSAFSTYNNL